MKHLLVVAGVLLAVGALAPGASAHAVLQSSDPANGATLDVAPASMTLIFSEPPDPDLSTFTVVSSGGSDAGGGSPTFDDLTVGVPLADGLGDGVYTLNWSVVSTADGHRTVGVIAFGVGETPTATPPTTTEQPTSVTPVAVVGRASLYAGLMLVAASALVGLGLFDGRPAALRVVIVAGGIAAFVGAWLMLLAEQKLVGVPMSDLLGSGSGEPYLWLLGITAVTAGLAVLGAARERWRVVWWAAGVAAAAAMWVRVSSGHAAAATPAPLPEIAQWAHFLAAGLWLGGLALFLLLLREPHDEPPTREARRFSTLALVAVAIVVVTGTVRSIQSLGGLDGFDTAYGRTLLAKIALALLVIGLGAWNRFRALPRLETDARPLRWVVRNEVVVSAGVILLTATLTGLPPKAQVGAPPPGPPPAVPASSSGEDFATTIRVSFDASPGIPGPNVYEVDLTDPDTGEPVAADQVRLAFTSLTRPEVATSRVELATEDGETWTGEGPELSLAGAWLVTATVRTGSEAVDVPLAIATGSDAPPAPEGASVASATYPTGISLQLSLDPLVPGEGTVHVTAFAPDGSELNVKDLVVVGVSRDDPLAAQRPKVTKFTEGHGATILELTEGEWLVDAVATTRDGRVLQATLVDVRVAAAA